MNEEFYNAKYIRCPKCGMGIPTSDGELFSMHIKYCDRNGRK